MYIIMFAGLGFKKIHLAGRKVAMSLLAGEVFS